MNAKLFYKILILFLGFLLITGFFIFLFPDMDNRAKVLNLISSYLLYANLSLFLFFPLIGHDEAKKEAGMIGIHLTATVLCTIASIGVMVVGFIYSLPFRIQLLLQLAVLLLLVLGRFYTLHAGEKVENVYCNEKNLYVGKEMILKEADMLLSAVRLSHDMNADDMKRIRQMCEDVRFLSPVDSKEAQDANIKIASLMRRMKTMIGSACPQQLTSSLIMECEELMRQRKNMRN